MISTRLCRGFWGESWLIAALRGYRWCFLCWDIRGHTSRGWTKRNFPVVFILRAQEGNRRKHLQCSQSDSMQSRLSVHRKGSSFLSRFVLSSSHLVLYTFFKLNSIRRTNHPKNLKRKKKKNLLRRSAENLAVPVNSIDLPLPGGYYWTSDIKKKQPVVQGKRRKLFMT